MNLKSKIKALPIPDDLKKELFAKWHRLTDEHKKRLELALENPVIFKDALRKIDMAAKKAAKDIEKEVQRSAQKKAEQSLKELE